MGFCSVATILQLFSLNSLWVFRPTSALCRHISGCGVYLDSWKSGQPEHALCAWAAYSLPGLLYVLLPPSWGCLRWIALNRHYLKLESCWVTQTIPMSFSSLMEPYNLHFSACSCPTPLVSPPWWTHVDLRFQETHAWVLWALFSATCLCEGF